MCVFAQGLDWEPWSPGPRFTRNWTKVVQIMMLKKTVFVVFTLSPAQPRVNTNHPLNDFLTPVGVSYTHLHVDIHLHSTQDKHI